jgi:uncharacterized delta-60 repeat protein
MLKKILIAILISSSGFMLNCGAALQTSSSSPMSFLSLNNQADTPTFTIPGGYYNTAQTMQITTTTPGAAIHYTVNGTAYTGTGVVNVNITSSMIVTAYASAGGMADSAVTAAGYYLDFTAPTCSIISPADTSEFVPVVTPGPIITIQFSDEMNPSTVTADGGDCSSGTVMVSTDSTFTSSCVALNLPTTTDYYTFNFQPASPLYGTTKYYVRVRNTAADVYGNTTGADVNSSFSTDLAGAPDASFNLYGYSYIPASYAQEGRGVKIQSDNRIVVAGATYTTGSDFAVWRFTSGGVYEMSFVTPAFSGQDDEANGIAITPSYIVVAGTTDNILTLSNDFGLAGYDVGGNLHPSFGTLGTGFTSLDFLSLSGDFASALAVDATDRIVAVGYTTDMAYATMNFATARFAANGSSLDFSFSSDGMDSVDFMALNGDDRALAVAIDPGANPSVTLDDHIVVAGWHDDGVSRHMALLAYDDYGTLLWTRTHQFGGISAAAKAVAIQPDGTYGKILVAGYVNISMNRIAVARYNSDGSIDSGFGTSGIGFTTIMVPGSTSNVAEAIALQKDGKILIAGTTLLASRYMIVLSRLNPDGTIDTTFGANGNAIFSVGGWDMEAKAMAVQPDGRVVVAGSVDTGTGNGQDVLVIRYR